MTSIADKIMNSPSGGTISLRGEDLPKTGYFVGGLVSPLIIPSPLEFAPDAKWEIEVFVSYLTESTDASYVGWWTDDETDNLWIDGTSWHPTELLAGNVGRERREIAVYDIAGQREVRLAYTEGELA
jgi:hypothetical protein